MPHITATVLRPVGRSELLLVDSWAGHVSFPTWSVQETAVGRGPKLVVVNRVDATPGGEKIGIKARGG